MFQLTRPSVPPAVCESGVSDDLCDGHVPRRVSKSLSPRVAAAVPLLRVLLPRPPSRHRGVN